MVAMLKPSCENPHVCTVQSSVYCNMACPRPIETEIEPLAGRGNEFSHELIFAEHYDKGLVKDSTLASK